MTLSPSDFREADATRADTEDIVNQPLCITSVAVSVLFVEHGDDIIRVSLRSKPPTRKGDPDVDVAAIAQSLGGGGHRRAAGVRITGSLSDIRSEITESIPLSDPIGPGKPDQDRPGNVAPGDLDGDDAK